MLCHKVSHGKMRKIIEILIKKKGFFFAPVFVNLILRESLPRSLHGRFTKFVHHKDKL